MKTRLVVLTLVLAAFAAGATAALRGNPQSMPAAAPCDDQPIPRVVVIGYRSAQAAQEARP